MRRILPLQWLLSLVFILQMYVAMLVLGIVFLIPALIDRRHAHTACRSFCVWVRLTLRLLCGLQTEVRGPVPSHECLIAAKHQSFLDIILIFGAVPRGKFIMKKELVWAPVLGWYALRIGCVPVDRGKRGAAIVKMKADVASGASMPGQLIIYPQGTRVAPGVKAPYKVGTALLYQQLDQDCVPVAANVGLFWPKRGILRKPGLAVVEFLPVIAPGLENGAFLEKLESDIETESDRLALQAT
ncbi:lysophospholipid acyltransferase family protein [Gemmobacter denitrificans]|uniref:Lysophospholipid acyltransferase family protein n=1 Tax=Gemmobacter denitrificans TaxID=3123040 RepID=A0ABU8BTZ1_9RHOB